MTTDNVFNWGDPTIGVDRTYLTSNIRKGVVWSNTQSYSNPRVDELLAKAAVETNEDKRKQLYKEFQQIVVRDAPVAFINVVPHYSAYDKRLKGLPMSIWGSHAPIDELSWE
jgi:peptide/nickel transport system substrate-binding protein